MIKMTSLLFAVSFTLTLITLSNSAALAGIDPEDILYASCTMIPDGTATVSGSVFFRQIARLDIEVMVDVQGLGSTPGSKHGFHVHELGDISGGCISTGGHFNPSGDDHAGPDQRDRHAGDFGNLVEDEFGNNESYFTDRKAMLVNNRRRILGRAIVIHENEDDLGLGGNAGSLATGNAGARIGCCVIGWSNGAAWINIPPLHTV